MTPYPVIRSVGYPRNGKGSREVTTDDMGTVLIRRSSLVVRRSSPPLVLPLLVLDLLHNLFRTDVLLQLVDLLLLTLG